MRTRFFVPIILGILLTAGVSIPRGSVAEPAAQAAADECLSKPGSTAPRGSHWFYRVDRATGRHCWYLGAEGTKARAVSPKPAAQPKEASKPTADSNPPVRAEAAAAPVPSAQAVRDEADATDTSAGQNGATPEFTTRWPALVKPLDAKAQDRFSAANSFAEELAVPDKQDDMPLVWPVLTPAERVAAGMAAAAKVRWEYLLAIIAAALALAATLIGAIFNRSSPLPSLRFDWLRRFDWPIFRRAPEPVLQRRPFGEVLLAVRQAEEAARRAEATRATAAAMKVSDRSMFAPRFARTHADDLPRQAPPPARPAPPVKPPSEAARSVARDVQRDVEHDVEASLEQLLRGWQRSAA
jgi:hypothetical protein